MDFKIGDIITAYHKGYWRLTRIEKRYVTESLLIHAPYKNSKVGDEISPLYYYKQVMTKDFVPRYRAAERCCDSFYCRLVDKEKIENIKKKYIEGCDYLLKLLDSQ